MKTLLELLQERFEQAALRAFPELQDFKADVAESEFSDYQCNSALKLSKGLKKSPQQIATSIIDQFDKTDLVDQLEVKGPGFINVTLSNPYLEKRLEAVEKDERLGVALPSYPQRMIVEYSGPNIAKEMHVGHLRSTIIGDALARLFRFLGHDVLALNHVGDWGTQFGMLITFIKKEHPNFLENSSNYSLTDLMHWYKSSKVRFDADSDFKKRAHLEVVALQRGDPTNKRVWEVICDVSRKGYQEIYDILDVHLTERGESFYNSFLPTIVEDLEKKGLLAISDGAKCVFVEAYKNREGTPQPLMVQKSDGGYNYDTTDMAAFWHRIHVEKATRIVIVTDAGQSLHFALVAAVAEMAGILDRSKVRFDHVPFGLVLGPDGKKFKTRSGETEKLIDLLNEGVQKAEAVLAEKKGELPPEERRELAQKIGIASVKYADLSNHRMSDYQFSYDKMLRFEGNTAAFILYSNVRAKSILRKSTFSIEAIEATPIEITHPSERKLSLHLLKFPDLLLSIAEELAPNRLTDYLYTLSDLFNAFFRDCRVLGSPEEKSRLKLTLLTSKTFEKGLSILGINPVEKM
jgi:arginyl-tRNA synthetase